MGVFNAEKAALWSERMAAFAASGQSRRAWCKAQGLSVNTFGYWQNRLRDRGSAATAEASRQRRSRRTADKGATVAANFVPVVVRCPAVLSLGATGSTPTIELTWPSGLRLSTSLGVTELAAFVRALSC